MNLKCDSNFQEVLPYLKEGYVLSDLCDDFNLLYFNIKEEYKEYSAPEAKNEPVKLKIFSKKQLIKDLFQFHNPNGIAKHYNFNYYKVLSEIRTYPDLEALLPFFKGSLSVDLIKILSLDLLYPDELIARMRYSQKRAIGAFRRKHGITHNDFLKRRAEYLTSLFPFLYCECDFDMAQLSQITDAPYTELSAIKNSLPKEKARKDIYNFFPKRKQSDKLISYYRRKYYLHQLET